MPCICRICKITTEHFYFDKQVVIMSKTFVCNSSLYLHIYHRFNDVAYKHEHVCTREMRNLKAVMYINGIYESACEINCKAKNAGRYLTLFLFFFSFSLLTIISFNQAYYPLTM